MGVIVAGVPQAVTSYGHQPVDRPQQCNQTAWACLGVYTRPIFSLLRFLTLGVHPYQCPYLFKTCSMPWTMPVGILEERLSYKRSVLCCPLPFLSPVHLAAACPAHRLFCSDSLQEGELLPSRGPNGRSHIAQPNGSASTSGDSQSGVHAPSPALSAPLQKGYPAVVRQPPPSLLENGSGSAGSSSKAGVRHAPSPAPSAPLQNGHPVAREPPLSRPDVTDVQGVRPSFDQNPLSQLGPVERSRTLKLRKMIMNPSLQFVCGPLLRYDTVDEHGAWHGAALIVSECRCIRSHCWNFGWAGSPNELTTVPSTFGFPHS